MKLVNWFILIGFSLVFFNCNEKNIPSQLDSTRDGQVINMKVEPVSPNDFKKVDSLVNINQIESAEVLLKNLLAQYQSKGQWDGYIRATLEMAAIKARQEEGQQAALNYLEEEIQKASSPVKSILYNILAKEYATSFSSMQYSLRNNTDGASMDPKDINTWSLNYFAHHIQDYFLRSLEDESTKNIEINAIDLITSKVKIDNLEPYLYDFLARNVLDYIVNTSNFLTEPIYKFQIKGADYFSPVPDFVKLNVESQDSLSAIYKSTLVFQRLLDHEMSKNNSDGLHFTNLRRLQFMHENSNDPDKGKYYADALKKLIASDIENEWKYRYEVARIQYEYSQDQYDPKTPGMGDRFYLKKLVGDIQNTQKKYPNEASDGALDQLLASIKGGNLNVQGEMVQMAGKPFLMACTYQNLTKASFQIYKATPDQYSQMIHLYDKDQRDALMQKMTLVKQLEQALVDFGDFRSHTVEIKFDGLELGQYILKLDQAEGTSNLAYLQVSNLAMMEAIPNSRDLFIVDRLTGRPLQGVEVKFFERIYDGGGAIVSKLSESLISTKDGMVNPKFKNNKSFQIQLRLGNDVLVGTDEYYFYENQPSPTREAKLFLDRAIYRPGQMVYFKGIVIDKSKEGLPSILPKHSIKVLMRDANGQPVTSLNLKSNDFGSFHGTFSIPSGLLTGQFSLEVEGLGSQEFKVEEYKRPKFKISFDTLSKAFVVGDQIEVKGHAESYSGTPIPNAEVKYSISRSNFFRPYDWMYGGISEGYGRSSKMDSRYYPIQQNETVLINGSVKTDEKGNFIIPFIASPNESIAPKWKPRFNYKIQVDITDLSGETRSNQQNLVIGYQKYQVEFSNQDKITLNQLRNLVVKTNNSSGIQVDTKGKLVIYRLDAPEQYLRPKLYETPEMVIGMDREQYKSLWNYEPWLNELDPRSWQTTQEVFSQNVMSSLSPQSELKTIQLNPGYYKVCFLMGAEQVSDDNSSIFYLTSLDDIASKFGISDLNYIETDKSSYEPGEQTQVTFGARNPSRFLLYEMFVKNKKVEYGWLDTKDVHQKRFKINEDFRGDVQVVVSSYGYSRINSILKNVHVPWSNKDLKIILSTFRDKLIPGQDEEWSLSIQDHFNKNPESEVLATMYDASLDEFSVHNYSKILFPSATGGIYFSTGSAQALVDRTSRIWSIYAYQSFEIPRPTKNSEFHLRQYYKQITEQYYGRYRPMMAEVMMAESDNTTRASTLSKRAGGALDEVAVREFEPKAIPPDGEKKMSTDLFPIRKNLDETVFFYPDLNSDPSGQVQVKFKMKEAITQWKFRVFAHTKDLKQGLIERMVTTSKDIMVFPNLPRFMRENDDNVLAAKIVNQTDQPQTARVQLEVLNATTLNAIGQYDVSQVVINPKGEEAVQWNVKAPLAQEGPVIIRISAWTEHHRDGEEQIIPVLTNRVLVTETMPLHINSGQEKAFTFSAMLNAMASKTAQPFSYTFEYTSNPAWFAIQALPYILEQPDESALALGDRLFSNSLASKIVLSNPKIKAVFDQWKSNNALQSNLQKNQALKNILLTETPWVNDAQSEAANMQNIALLFDVNNLTSQQNNIIKQLKTLQYDNGGFAWYPGGRENQYVSSYLIEMFGKMEKMQIRADEPLIREMVRNAILYCDQEVNKTYQHLQKLFKDNAEEMKKDHLDPWVVQYLYARSFFNVDNEFLKTEAAKYFVGQSKKYWASKNNYLQGMIALFLSRQGDIEIPILILEGLKQTAFKNEELGYYWKFNAGYYWYESPIELQALMIETFAELTKDQTAIDQMKVWLLKNKQTNYWKSTKATTASIYALLIKGSVLNLDTKAPTISFSGTPWKLPANLEAGTGYFKQVWQQNDVNKNLTNWKVKNNSSIINWGAGYFQYFEDIDKVNIFTATPIKIEREYYKVKDSDRGETLVKMGADDPYLVGDLIRVRIVIKVDRPMDFMHLKDMRPAGFEPLNTISNYKYQGNLGYYESTKDVASHFYFDHIDKGSYVFEYDLRANLKGDFSSGIAQIQCLYAPEFLSHSQGQRILIQ